MNYSDYDSDGYSSNEDADYVPSDDNLSEDDMNECVREDPLGENDTVPNTGDVSGKKKRKKSEDLLMRKRKKGGLKLADEDGRKSDRGATTTEKEAPPEDGGGDKRVQEENKQKKKADDLWANFLSDVGSRPKPPSTPATETSSTHKVNLDQPPTEPKVAAKKPEPTMVTITKVFDFAGEEVRVTKEVSADSKEAKGFLKSQSNQEKESGEEQKQCLNLSKPLSSGPSLGTKRPVGMSSILGRIGGKKQKMSTLEKSKMDWDAFKSEEGITEELAIHNRGKEGYVERKNFLERVDHRQFELEKAVRLSKLKQ